MRAEGDPLDPLETVLRLIHPEFYKPSLPVPVAPAAFRPAPPDTDGLSVFRSECVETPAEVLRAIPDESKRPIYHIARIPISDLRRHGLTLRPAPIPEVPGHMIIPELSLSSYQADKGRWKLVQVALAKLASVGIVHHAMAPPPQPRR